MKRALFACAVLAFAFMLGGCDDDQRRGEEKEITPDPDYASRQVMRCPKCGAPQRPYRTSQIKSYYKCSGLAPKFKFHNEYKWSHRAHDCEQ
mgnify:CR=1 FL=1